MKRNGTFRNVAILIMAGIVLSSIVGIINPVSAQEDFVVTIGHDKTITTSNVHMKSTEVAPVHIGKGSPVIIEATSTGQEASTHILSETQQEGNAQSWNGVEFKVNASDDGKLTQDAEVSITFDYSLSNNFQVPPPSEGGGGSADDIIWGVLPGEPAFIVDRIGFVHYNSYDARSKTTTLKKSVTLEAGQKYQLLTYIYSYADIYNGGFGDSQASVLVKEVNINFSKRPTININGARMIGPSILGVNATVEFPKTEPKDGPRYVELKATINGQPVKEQIDVTNFVNPGEKPELI